MDTSLPVFDKYLLTGNIFKPGVDVQRWQDAMKGRVTADAARRRAMAERVQFFRDDTLHLVRKKLQQQFEMENTLELFKTLDISDNLLKGIIEQTSTIFDRPAQYELEGEDDGGAWAEIRESAQYDLVMQQVNQLVNLCNEVFVRVAVHRGRVDFQVWTPDNMMVDRSQKHPERIEAVWLWVGAAPAWDEKSKGYEIQQGAGAWHYWNADTANPAHHVFDENFQLLDAARGIDGVNPYKDQDGRPVIPGVMFHRTKPINSPWDETSGNDLVDGCAMLMGMASLINHFFRVDAWQQKWITGELQQEDSDGQTLSPLRPMVLRAVAGGDVQVGQFRSQADWKGLLEVVDGKADKLLARHGLTLGSRAVSGNPSSGFALKVQRQPLLEIRRRQVKLYRLYEGNLYDVSAAVWNVERERAETADQAGMPADGKPMAWGREAKLRITYSEYEVPLTAAERQAELVADQVELSMGLKNIVDLYLERHPEASRKDAEKRVKENLELNKKYLPNNELVAGRAEVLPVDGGAAAGAKPGAPASSPPAAPATSPANPMAGAGPTTQPQKPKAK